MHKKIVTGAALALVAAGIAAFSYFWNENKQAADTFISPDNQTVVAHGKRIYSTHCAACHGAALEGQGNWRQRREDGRLPAPPHDASGHTWHHPDAVLIEIVKNGLVPGKTAPEGYESDMPGFGHTLSDADIAAVLAYIKSTWPPEILELQKGVTLQRDEK